MRRKKDYRKVSSHHSATVIDRKKKIRDLAGSLAAQGDTAAAGLEDELRCVLEEGEEMPDVRFLLELMERRLRRAGEDLDRADEKRWLEQMRASVTRHESREAQRDLHGEMVRVRKSLVDCFGSKRCRRQLGLSERTPRGATDLAFEARRVVDLLSREDLELPEMRLPGLCPDPQGWVDCLEAPLERLEAAVKALAGRRVRVVDGIAGCQEALASCDATFLHVARAAEALFVLAGQPELARRLRPSESRERVRGRANPVELLPAAPRVRPALSRCRSWLGAVLDRRWGALRAWRARRRAPKSQEVGSRRWHRGGFGPESPEPALSAPSRAA